MSDLISAIGIIAVLLLFPLVLDHGGSFREVDQARKDADGD